ncbi:type II toxin-antitoxin system HicA family toxin [Candidatus Peregrinibacteria bacterium]|nr:type II toxin-antitoxin system HicA family toxin [Candidatus Peregrinibacteria bacterium]
MDFTAQIRELIDRPTELRFKQVQTILYDFSYKLVNSKGSHFRFKKNNFLSITIVVHSKKVKKWYVRRMCKILLSQLPLSAP